MSLFLGILMTVLKILGLVLLVLLVLLIVALLMPIGVFVNYKAALLRVEACCGPLRFKVLSHKMSDPLWPESADKADEKDKTPPGDEKKEKTPEAKPEEELEEEPKTKLPRFLQRRVDAILQLAKEDPLTLAERALCHGGWLFDHLLRGLRVRKLSVYWTVTAQDAAETAVRYGAVMAAANNLLLLLRTKLSVRSEELRIDPDFTGEHAAQRRCSFFIKTRPGILLVILLRLLHRVWVDRELQPAKPEKHS